MKKFIFEISNEDAIKACENFLLARKKSIKDKRVKAIKKLTTEDRFKFFGLINKGPECKSVKDAIRRMKISDYYFGSWWNSFKNWGYDQAVSVEDLLEVLTKTDVVKSSTVKLDADMAFLISWI